MGYREAVEDGVRMYDNKRTNINSYYPKCQYCGKETMSFSYIRENNYTCKECKLESYLSDNKSRQENNREAKDRKFKNALGRIRKETGRTTFAKYEKAIKIIEKYLHKDGWFDSTEEIMVAIELCRRGIRFYHQVKFGRYRADFVLPDEKVVLEVDGTLFHTEKTREKENLRDNLIILSLGAGWEVVRITDKDINEDITQLVYAIKEVKKKRAIIRRKNNGLLPDWYSNKSR